MKIRLMKRIAILTLLTVSIVGCRDYLDDDYYDHGRSSVPGRRNPSLDRAVSWYEQQKQGEETMLKFPDGKEQLFYTEPSWKYRLETRTGKFYTLEVDLTDRIALDFVTDENAAEYERTGDFRYKHSVTRLVIQSNEKTGDKIGFLMTIIPSPSFTKQFYGRMNRNTYLNRDPDFDGLVVYHHLDGTFSNGWKYEKGEVVMSLIESTGEDVLISYRTIPETYKVSQAIATRSGEETYDGGELPPAVVVGNGGGGGGGSGGGYSGGGSSGGGGGSGYPGGNGAYNPSPSITLFSSNSVIDIMESYNVMVYTSSGTITNALFIISKGTQEWTLQNGSNTICTKKALKAGTWQIKAKVYLSSGEFLQSINSITVTVQYPDVNTIRNNSTVSSKMATVWSQTKSAASSSGRSERGFWIYVNTSNIINSYECGATIVGPNITGCVGTHASIAPGSSGESISNSPITGGKYAVAFFHTHTPLTYCSGSARQVGPSSTDISWHASHNIPGLLYDYTGSTVPGITGNGIIGGHTLSATAQIYNISPSRKSTPN